VLRRVAFLVFAQRVGLTLDEISAELAKLPHDHAPEGEDWTKLSSGWTARIDGSSAVSPIPATGRHALVPAREIPSETLQAQLQPHELPGQWTQAVFLTLSESCRLACFFEDEALFF
jgi:hypothetical protein